MLSLSPGLVIIKRSWWKCLHVVNQYLFALNIRSVMIGINWLKRTHRLTWSLPIASLTLKLERLGSWWLPWRKEARCCWGELEGCGAELVKSNRLCITNNTFVNKSGHTLYGGGYWKLCLHPLALDEKMSSFRAAHAKCCCTRRSGID